MYIYLPPGMKYWQDRVEEFLNLLHEMDDGSSCFLLPDDDDAQIYDRSHFPKILCVGKKL